MHTVKSAGLNATAMSQGLALRAPVLLAYGARYAFESDLAFYAVLLFDVALGAVVYWIAMESAVATTEAQKEQIVTILSRSESPVAG